MSLSKGFDLITTKPEEKGGEIWQRILQAAAVKWKWLVYVINFTQAERRIGGLSSTDWQKVQKAFLQEWWRLQHEVLEYLWNVPVDRKARDKQGLKANR